jgi:hypothetical protein
MDRLDSTHFVSFSPTTSPFPGRQHQPSSSTSADDPLTFGIGSRSSSSSGVNYAEEYRVIDAFSTNRRPGEPSTRGSSDDETEWIDVGVDERSVRAPPYRGVFQLFDFEILRVVFIALDALLLVHRITNVYVGVRLVSLRFADGRVVDDEEDDQLPVDVDGGDGVQRPTMNSNHRGGGSSRAASSPHRRQQQGDAVDAAERSRLQMATLKYTVADDGGDDNSEYLRPVDARNSSSTLTRSGAPVSAATADYCGCRQFDGPTPPVPPPAFTTSFIPKYGARRDNAIDCFDANTTSASSTTTTTTAPVTVADNDGESDNVLRTVIARMLQSGAVPKAIVAVVLTLLFYIVARSAVVVLDAGLLTAVASASLGIHGDAAQIVDTVEVRVNETNRCVEDEARQLNELAAIVYGGQMRVELLNLQALVEFFNAGMSRRCASLMLSGVPHAFF